MHHPQQPRRKFLLWGTAGILTAVLSKLPKVSFGQSSTNIPKGIIVHQDEGTHLLTGRRKNPMSIKISKAEHGVENISFCAEDIMPTRKIRVHKHLYSDELIFIHRGEGIFTMGEELVPVKEGTVMFVPKGVWHGLENTGKDAIRMLFGYSPAGFENYFIENGTLAGSEPRERTAEQYAIAEKKYGMVYKEPS